MGSIEKAEREYDGGGCYTKREEDMIDRVLFEVIADRIRNDKRDFTELMAEAIADGGARVSRLQRSLASLIKVRARKSKTSDSVDSPHWSLLDAAVEEMKLEEVGRDVLDIVWAYLEPIERRKIEEDLEAYL